MEIKKGKRHIMRNRIKLTLFLVMIAISFGLTTNAVVKSAPKAAPQAAIQAQKPAVKPDVVYDQVNSLDVVTHPAKYLNKHIKIKAKFDKFSTLGLDYKPAFRSSEKYITFLIKRDDVISHTIPLSEMKNFLSRTEAEKYIDLSSGDEIEYSGTVFSNALGDVWIDVEKFTVISQKNKPTKK